MRVLVADALSEAGVEALAASLEVDVRTGLSKDELVAIAGDYDAIVVRSATTIDADVIAAANKLKVVARAGIGLDNVDVEAATARGVMVCNAPQSNVVSAAEHTLALLLSMARQIPAADASLRAHEWRRGDFQGVELHGKVLGVVGLGRVGVLVAQRAHAFGMRLMAYDPFVSAERAANMGVELVPTVRDLCAVADILTVHLPKTPETVGIVGAEELAAMKPTARIVNTARGGIVDEAALHEVLSARRIAGAALDVFSTEPMTDSPLFDLDNVVVTPHLGASTTEAQDKAGTMVAEAVVAALAGDFVPSAVNVALRSGVPESLRPFMGLAERLGHLVTALQPSATGELTVEYLGRIAGEDCSAVTLSALRGFLSPISHEPVTFVNAPLLAEERGIKVTTTTSSATEDFVSLIRLTAGGVRVAGTLVGPTDRERIVEVWGLPVDMGTADHMVFLRYSDRPGMVGTIGSRLGEAGINIASMQVGRMGPGGDAVIAMTIDEALPPGVLEEIAAAIGATEARAVDRPGT